MPPAWVTSTLLAALLGGLVVAAPTQARADDPPADAGIPDRAFEEGAPQPVWLEWTAPEDDERVEGPVGWVEVRGWAGVGNRVRHDVVIVIDVSGSTAVASGVDVDGDGTLGKRRRRLDPLRSYNPRHYSSDLDDTVLSAELVATRRLVSLLDPDRTRIGLVAFASGARILAPLGSDMERIDAVLRDLEGSFGSGSTNLAEAIARATEALQAGEISHERRRKTILVLSDGFPTVPGTPRLAAERALEEASAAVDLGVRLNTFALGLETAGTEDVYAVVARVSGGAYRRLDRPGEIIHELPRVDLADVAGVEIDNLTTGTTGRAVRVRPDGSFDGFLRLADGDNRIRVNARSDAGSERSDHRVVVFDEREPRDADEAAAFDERIRILKRTLAHRRVETELVNEIEAARAQRRALVIGVEDRDTAVSAGDDAPEGARQ